MFINFYEEKIQETIYIHVNIGSANFIEKTCKNLQSATGHHQISEGERE